MDNLLMVNMLVSKMVNMSVSLMVSEMVREWALHWEPMWVVDLTDLVPIRDSYISTTLTKQLQSIWMTLVETSYCNLVYGNVTN